MIQDRYARLSDHSNLSPHAYAAMRQQWVTEYLFATVATMPPDEALRTTHFWAGTASDDMLAERWELRQAVRRGDGPAETFGQTVLRFLSAAAMRRGAQRVARHLQAGFPVAMSPEEARFVLAWYRLQGYALRRRPLIDRWFLRDETLHPIDAPPPGRYLAGYVVPPQRPGEGIMSGVGDGGTWKDDPMQAVERCIAFLEEREAHVNAGLTPYGKTAPKAVTRERAQSGVLAGL